MRRTFFFSLDRYYHNHVFGTYQSAWRAVSLNLEERERNVRAALERATVSFSDFHLRISTGEVECTRGETEARSRVTFFTVAELTLLPVYVCMCIACRPLTVIKHAILISPLARNPTGSPHLTAKTTAVLRLLATSFKASPIEDFRAASPACRDGALAGDNASIRVRTVSPTYASVRSATIAERELSGRYWFSTFPYYHTETGWIYERERASRGKLYFK